MFRIKTILSIFGIIALVHSADASDRLLNTLKPRPGAAVYDVANVISSADENKLESMIDELEQKTGAEIAVVTIQSLEGGQIDDFTNRLVGKWGIGQKGKDNGLLFVAAMQDRQMRIEVGYGLEGAIPDAKAGRIRRDVIRPYFKAGNPGGGIVAGVAMLSQEVAKEYDVQLTGSATQYRYNQRSGQRAEKEVHPLVLLIFGIGFVIFAIRHPHLAMLLLTGGRGGGHSSGGGFGGGGGGFGGGMSGGGGSSGGW